MYVYFSILCFVNVMRQCLLSDADNTDMDMADVEIGAGCCQQAAKGGVCI